MIPDDPKSTELITKMGSDAEVSALARTFFDKTCEYRYSYNFTWLGRPIIQYPQDVMAMQEIIWKVDPHVIIETGIAHGGSLVFYASMLELRGGSGIVVGVDIDIRERNRSEIEKHPMHRRIRMIEGSSTSADVVRQIESYIEHDMRVLVVLDSNHTHDHVLEELRQYSRFVSPGSYVVVFDTVIEDMPEDMFPDRPWGRGNSPKTAVREFLASSDRFVIDREIQDKLLISVAPDGYLLCVK